MIWFIANEQIFILRGSCLHVIPFKNKNIAVISSLLVVLQSFL